MLATVGQLAPRDGGATLLQKGQSSLPLPGSTLPALLSSGDTSPVVVLSSGAPAPIKGREGLILSDDHVKSVLKRASIVAQSKRLERPEIQDNVNVEETDGLQVEEEKGWDGKVLTEEQLEELVHTIQKPSTVEQKGRDFYDSDGNFLYRI